MDEHKHYLSTLQPCGAIWGLILWFGCWLDKWIWGFILFIHSGGLETTIENQQGYILWLQKNGLAPDTNQGNKTKN